VVVQTNGKRGQDDSEQDSQDDIQTKGREVNTRRGRDIWNGWLLRAMDGFGSDADMIVFNPQSLAMDFAIRLSTS
jgi:hypothetical protein